MVVVDVPYFCKATDAFAGTYRVFEAAFTTRAEAQARANYCYETDPEARPVVLPELPVAPYVAEASADDDVPF